MGAVLSDPRRRSPDPRVIPEPRGKAPCRRDSRWCGADSPLAGRPRRSCRYSMNPARSSRSSRSEDGPGWRCPASTRSASVSGRVAARMHSRRARSSALPMTSATPGSSTNQTRRRPSRASHSARTRARSSPSIRFVIVVNSDVESRHPSVETLEESTQVRDIHQTPSRAPSRAPSRGHPPTALAGTESGTPTNRPTNRPLVRVRNLWPRRDSPCRWIRNWGQRGGTDRRRPPGSRVGGCPQPEPGSVGVHNPNPFSLTHSAKAVTLKPLTRCRRVAGVK